MRKLIFAALFIAITLRQNYAQSTPEALVPLGRSIPTFMQCTRNPLGVLGCLPVRFLPSVRAAQQPDGSTLVSGPDPSRALWVQAQAPITGDYNVDAAAIGSTDPMPPNYFCIDLSPALSGSGAAVLMFDASIGMNDGASVRISGLVNASGSPLSQAVISSGLAAAVAWPDTWRWTTPFGAMHYYPIGVGCRNFPAISFESSPSFTVQAVYVFVSIP